MTNRVIDEALLRRYVREPVAEDNKYSRGVLGFVTGSPAYPGAALIGVEAALRTGVGMVRYLGPKAVADLVLRVHPEVVIHEGVINAAVVGSGISGAEEDGFEEATSRLAKRGVPVVVDAGALEVCEAFGHQSILTPHSGELEALHARLGLSSRAEDLDRGIQVASHMGVSVVVKGSVTSVVSASGDVWTLPVATPWLATAGTGDALAGIIGALLAAHSEPLDDTSLAEIAVVGSVLHQRAALRASLLITGDADSHGGPITVGDLCQALPFVVSQILNR